MRHRAPHLHSALMTSVSWYQWSGAGRLFRGLGVQWETFLGEKYGLYACLYVILSGFFLPFLVLLSFSACLCSVHQSYHCLKRRLTESFPSHPRRPPCYPITDPSYPGMEGNSGRPYFIRGQVSDDDEEEDCDDANAKRREGARLSSSSTRLS